MPNHTTAGRALRRGSVIDFQAWLRRRLAIEAVTKLRVIRTSSSDVEAWTASAKTSFASLDRENDPDVVDALAHGFDVVRRDIIGDSKRAELGDRVFVLRLHHAQTGAGASQVGVILHVGNTLFLYLLTSARAANLKAELDDRRGNAATEIISTAMREMATAGAVRNSTFRPELHAREHNRIVRSEHHGTLLKTTLTSCRAVVFNPTRVDLLDRAQAQSFTFGTLMEAAAVEGLIRGMNRSEVVMQSTGGFYEHIGLAPFTHGPLTYDETDPRSGRVVRTVNVHRLAPVKDVDEARARLRRLVDKVLEAKPGRPGREPVTDWDAVGDLGAELDLPSRMAEHVKHGILLQDLPSATRGRAMRSLFGERWVEGWRTGGFTKLVRIKTQLDLELGADIPLVTQDGVEYYRCRIDMPLPEGGWGISDQEWDEVLRRRRPAANKPVARTGERFPLAGVVEWDDQATGRQVQLFTKSRYVLRSRPLSEAYDHRGRRGWERGDTFEQLATLRPKELHRSVGKAMQTALEAMGTTTEPLVVATPHPRDATGTNVRDWATDLKSAEDDVESAQDQLDGAEDRLNEVLGRHRRSPDPAAVARAESAVDRASSRHLAAQADLAELQRRAAEEPTAAAEAAPETALVETATAEFMSVALEKCEAAAPAWLNQACQHFLVNWQVTLDRRPGRRDQVQWACNVALRLTDSGEEVLLPIHGTVTSSAYRKTSDSPTNVEDWAWRFFYLGESLPEIAAFAGMSTNTGKNSYLYSQLHRWLKPAVPDSHLRAAALHCPVPATRRILWSMVTNDPAALQGINAKFAAHVARVYAGAPNVFSLTWCRDTHHVARQVSDLLAASPEHSLPCHELLEALQVGYEPLLRLARKSTSQKRNLSAQPLPFFTKTFHRTSNLEPDAKRLALRPCPHPDCPERMRGGQGWCTAVLRTPETEGGNGVLCPSCRRLPEPTLRNVRFPADYLRPWSGRFGPGSKKAARQEHEATFVDTAFVDPGPAPALPDVGVVPRQWDGKITHTGKEYIPAHVVRVSPMGAKRFYVIDDTGEASDGPAGFITENGGRIARKLVRSVAAVIVPRPGFASPQTTRAAELGIPVITAKDFMSTPPDAWA